MSDETSDAAMTDAFKAWAREAIGHTEEEVTTAVLEGGGEVRVTKRDGVNKICTRDFHPNRANLKIEKGIVTAIDFG